MADKTPIEKLQEILETLLGSDAVYFQPPSSLRMAYPCIVFERSNIDTKFANNSAYSHQKEYTLNVIDADPESVIPDKVSDLPRCAFDRHFVVDNLYHDVFTLYF